MTFEEFFQKKKIDLKGLGSERPGLLEEFRKHFALMGEKSFDHTKKYWFNKLRRSYPLKEEASAARAPRRPAPASATSGATTAAAAAPNATTPAAGEKTDTRGTGDKPGTGAAPASKPAGFKPRFKPGKTTTKPRPAEPAGPATGDTTGKATPNTQDNPTPDNRDTPGTGAAPASKPAGFKPRFRPGVTPVRKKDSGD